MSDTTVLRRNKEGDLELTGDAKHVLGVFADQSREDWIRGKTKWLFAGGGILLVAGWFAMKQIATVAATEAAQDRVEIFKEVSKAARLALKDAALSASRAKEAEEAAKRAQGSAQTRLEELAQAVRDGGLKADEIAAALLGPVTKEVEAATGSRLDAIRNALRLVARIDRNQHLISESLMAWGDQPGGFAKGAPATRASETHRVGDEDTIKLKELVEKLE